MLIEVYVKDGKIKNRACLFKKESLTKRRRVLSLKDEKLDDLFNLKAKKIRNVNKKDDIISFKSGLNKYTIYDCEEIMELRRKNHESCMLFSRIDRVEKKEKNISQSKINRKKGKEFHDQVISTTAVVDEQLKSKKKPPKIDRGKRIATVGAATVGVAIVIIAGFKVEEGIETKRLEKEMYQQQRIEKLEQSTDQVAMIIKDPIKNKAIVITKNIELPCGSRAYSEKAINTREKYGDLITKYANMYGVPKELMIAIATQERGEHSSVMDDGGATGLMQIQNSIWIGNSVTAYNYETNQYETLWIDENNIGDLETNIKAGCMIFSSNKEYFNDNPIPTLLSYNMGPGSIDIILEAYENATGISRKEALEDVENLDWMNYIDEIKYGDPDYIENVLSYIEEGTELEYKTDNNIVTVLKVKNLEKENVRL